MTTVVAVSGAASQIGWFLLPRLLEAGYRVLALTRRDPVRLAADAPWWRRAPAAVEWRRCAIGDPAPADLPQADVWIGLGPLALLPPLVPALASRGVRRVIAFGSTSRFTKTASPSVREQALVLALERAEDQLAEACRRHGLAWTVFRPTLVYGAGVDRNVALIASAIRRFGFFPLVAGGRGLRQPVHADDLAAACVAAIGCGRTFGRAYNLSGGETLSYRAMVARVFEALGRRPRLVPVPLAALRLALATLSVSPRYRDFNVEMARRMGDDMVFDHAQASADFGYAPRRFAPIVSPPAA